LVTVATMPLALEKACSFLSQGMNVSKIEGIAPHQGMNAGEIRLACLERRTKR